MPFLGFGALPKYKAAIIDIHGTEDDVIPYSVDNIGSYGRGPEGETSSVVSYDGMFYLEKLPYIQFLGKILLYKLFLSCSLVVSIALLPATSAAMVSSIVLYYTRRMPSPRSSKVSG